MYRLRLLSGVLALFVAQTTYAQTITVGETKSIARR